MHICRYTYCSCLRRLLLVTATALAYCVMPTLTAYCYGRCFLFWRLPIWSLLTVMDWGVLLSTVVNGYGGLGRATHTPVMRTMGSWGWGWEGRYTIQGQQHKHTRLLRPGSCRPHHTHDNLGDTLRAQQHKHRRLLRSGSCRGRHTHDDLGVGEWGSGKRHHPGPATHLKATVLEAVSPTPHS